MPAVTILRRRPILHLLLLLAAASAVSSAGDERDILLEFKSHLSITGAATSPLDSWRSDSPISSFSGVTRNSDGLVNAIDLTGVGLSGYVNFTSVCRLPALDKLAVGSNSLYGEVGAELRSCAGFLYLDLASNSFSGAVPDLSALVKLQVLNLSGNGFSGDFPWESLKGLTDLREIILGDNPFSPSEFPTVILGLKNLQSIYLSNVSLTGDIPSAIGGLTELYRLELSTNSMTGSIPAEIGKLSKLKTLEIYENQFFGDFPTGFGNLTNLEFFDASSNRLTGTLREIAPMVNLISLQLFNNSLSGEIPPEFGDFRRLVNFSIYSNMLNGSLPPAIGSWADFIFIDASDNFLSGEIPPDMCKRGTMKKLLILDNNLTGEIPATYGDCKTMIRFRVSSNDLSGVVPAKIWGLPNAEIIDLQYNRLEGPITADIGGAAKLGTLSIASNKFSGVLPIEISKATNLLTVDLSDNEFTGELPAMIGKLSGLNDLYLQNNRFSGPIPTSLSSCRSLNQLNLAGNSLSGSIPTSLGSIPSLNYLNFSDNQLSGEIPASLSALRLSTLDLTNNRLSGRVPDSLAIGAYSGSFEGNAGLCSPTSGDLPSCTPMVRNSSKIRTLITALLAITAAALASLGCFLFAKKQGSDKDSPSRQDSWDLKPYQVLTFTEQDVVSGIRPENLIGKGGSGDVYRVTLPNGKDLAVKHIWTSTDKGTVDNHQLKSKKITSAMLGSRRHGKAPELAAEVSALSSLRHVNVVKLFCSITGDDSSLLVYEYLPNGSLWDRLHTDGKTELDWLTRYEIALGSAKGLEYLHHGWDRPIIHRDVKSSNILLDDFFKPRIADFGLAKMVDPDSAMDSVSVIPGTYGYIAPEYGFTNKVNEKSDLYSFGVVLMELVTGRRPVEPEFGENKDIVGWVSSKMTSRESVMGVIDKKIPEAVREDVVVVLRIAVLCTARLPALRPTMRTVVQMLEDAEPCKLVRIVSVKDGKGEEEGRDSCKL